MNAQVQPGVIDITQLLTRKVEITDMVARAQVTNDDEEKRANDLLKIIKNAIKAADEERKGAVEWFNTKVKEINSKYKDEIIGPMEAAKVKLEALIKPFTMLKLKAQQEADRLMREALERQALEDAQSAATPEAADQMIETAVKASDRIGKPATVRSAYGAVTSSRIVYKFELEDLDQVPREYLVLDESKVRKAINGEKRVESIPGIKIIEDVSLTSR
jgi:hypothetical protein